MKLEPKYEEALQKFVKRYYGNKNIIGIILTGSFVHSRPDKNSDLDIHLVLKESKTRERGNTWINGVEVEYFMNPIKQIENYFKEDFQKGKRVTAHMFVNSRVLYERGKELREVIAKARKSLKLPLKKMSSGDIELARYFIDDLEKDLEDSYIKKDEFSFNEIANELLDKCLNLFFKINGKENEKPKRLFNYLFHIDKKFANIYRKALLEKKRSARYAAIIKTVRYTEELLGGKRSREWKFITKCDYMGK